jgi:hypothetical protein
MASKTCTALKSFHLLYVSMATGNGIRRVDGAGNPINTDFDLYTLGCNGITNLSKADVNGQVRDYKIRRINNPIRF